MSAMVPAPALVVLWLEDRVCSSLQAVCVQPEQSLPALAAAISFHLHLQHFLELPCMFMGWSCGAALSCPAPEHCMV